jgi:hypothetical protein
MSELIDFKNCGSLFRARETTMVRIHCRPDVFSSNICTVAWTRRGNGRSQCE